ncbi:frataxin [Anticarsia gemmatalis]|uniref:frataxin n=1 Tax=Anticarsia gemmatalis TaxID=129554 RepID=UPI003F76354D
MFRNIIRTSRWVARRQINIITQIALRRYSYVSVRNNTIITLDRKFSSTTPSTTEVSEVDQAVFEDICNETLESLCDYFEEIVESAPNLKGADVTYSDGVLTVALGSSYGTYVINRQTPNKQIWLSSPTSGPKRYDLVLDNGGHWIYKHDGMSLHQLLQNEISKIVENKIEFQNCAHSLV